MRAQESPFRPYWWATGLSGLEVDARPDISTYGRYKFEDLPPVPFDMDGDLAWLARQPEQDECVIVGNAAEALGPLTAHGAEIGLPLPGAFIRFMASEALQRRVRSNTSCYLDLDTASVPVKGGRLVRFLADQQGCLFWYLFVTEDGADHAVVCSPDFFDSEEGEAADDVEAICFCAESFETFLCRYWLENEIWLAANDYGPMPEVGPEYIERYRDMPGF